MFDPTPSAASPQSLDRRQLLQMAGSALATAANSTQSSAQGISASGVKPFRNYREVLARLEARGRKWRVLGAAPDGSPIVAVKCGGDKLPAIFISGGAHSTEHAGATATVEVIEQLKTQHQVWVIPARDPIGLSGFRHALSLGLGQPPKLDSHEQLDNFLRKHGDVLYDADGTLLVQIGEHGYANRGLLGKFEKGAKFLEPLLGRRIWYASRRTDTPGSGPLERAYTLIVTPDGEILHLNRFHDTAWAPAEVRCVRQLLAEIKPALTFDMHEHDHGAHYWMSARRQRTEEDEVWERRMAAEAVRAVKGMGSTLAPDSYSPGSFFDKLEPGVFWLDAGKRGQGLNLVDFAAKHYGPGFTIETGMQCPFEERVRQHLTVAQTAVNVFEQRYR
ncbi:MAG: hypothetical protein JNM18_25365 [Planctomycetaceae bacterium]|nr:hypothetical protein [Planctomycetaceae bacterium]